MLENELNLKEFSLLLSFAVAAEQNGGYRYVFSDKRIQKLQSLRLIGIEKMADPSKLKEGEEFYMIRKEGLELVDQLKDYCNGILEIWDKRNNSKYVRVSQPTH